MSKPKTKSELQEHKNIAIQKLDDYIANLIETGNPKMMGKADKLSYWIKDWSTFLTFEPQFSSTSMRRYKRGEIIKVHLGFNVGSEEGGLHYAVVLNKENSIHNPVLTIVPLTSVKPTKDLSRLRKGEVFLGNELYVNLNSKLSTHLRLLQEKLNWIETELTELEKFSHRNAEFNERLETVRLEHTRVVEESTLTQKMQMEINKMKSGSIALVNQITTISKIRIYDPKTNHDILSGIKLSNEKLDSIDYEVISNYTNAKL